MATLPSNDELKARLVASHTLRMRNIESGDLQIVGEGGNRSDTGVYFIAEASAPVDVVVDGQVRRAELVRVENRGHGRLGVAVRFVDTSPGE